METQKIIKKSSFLRVNELTKGLVTAKGSPVGFMLIDSEIPQWINADRIYSLWDIAYKLGKFYSEGITNNPFIGFKLSKRNPIAIEVFPHGFTVAIGKGNGLIEAGVLLIELRNGLRVIWHNELTCIGVDDFIFETYSVASKAGEMLNGRLKFTEETAVKEEQLLNVDELFSMCSLAGPFHECDDEEVLRCFDKPQLLDVITTEIGKFAVLKEHKNEKETQIVARLEKLKHRGVDLQKIGELDLDEITKLHETMMT